MKKVIALIIALLMALSLTPAVFAAAEENEEPARDVSVTYTGQTVNATNLNVGGKFQFTLSVSANSKMWSGHWLIDYPEEYVTPTNYSVTWSGGITYAINQSWEEGNPTSDKPNFVCNKAYEGMTGSTPYGEAGNMYSVVGMFLTTFEHGGLQMGGPFIRMTYQIDRFPSTAVAQHDSTGYYLEFPIIVLESRYWIPGAEIVPGNEYYHTHENITVINGKVYMQAVQTSAHAVRFYNFQGQLISTQEVEDGQAATAPSIPEVINNSQGTYVFYAWDQDFSHVTSDLDVHPIYPLLGDTNLSGEVTAEDALLALRAALELNTLNGEQICAGDVNRSGEVTSEDALNILRYTLGLLDSLSI